MIEDFITRPDIGACYCTPDSPDRCRWDGSRWVGPCVRDPDIRIGNIGFRAGDPT